MPTMDQVVWATANVVVDGKSVAFKRGDLLPDPVSQEETSMRTTLRLGGALRVVEVVYTPEELAEQATQRAEATARNESANDVDQSLPMGDQVPGTAEPGRPTLMTSAGGPVVLGTEDDRKAAVQAQGRGRSAGTPAKDTPPAKDDKADDKAVSPDPAGGAIGAGSGRGTGSAAKK